ncbi:translation initiation factor IF-2 [Mycoplasmopsis californica HAZ160_1]|uniref:Translation initiation factor IF-2 n=1 Tax=Mycoplasmopsis californica HAZ160_1 TaxID=1397850 RepID=A0AAT9F7I3_9BACT|nr:translation initiation factor IF-2 [Mycoplasmopsis californica]BAP00866.1 translation initiation factor IF-2 [Mycoplasmopsis californica HAZ160_1]BBG40723.1 translation initiation factor IF-2 [Mycoplasmopsis californica]BBG41317.1 translation initiation factor IF-2 [Mycoplasmopsis californica]BBG41910.1 translation initiation factor IF-2 [Mycoplasmopsis californica]BBG42502.1 translation initiation factor IF-2 [Mycoplasmopsis californica]
MSKKNRLSNQKDVESQLKNIKTEVKNGVFIFTNSMPLGEFATKIGLNANDLIKRFMMRGKMYQINHMLEEEEIAEVCLENGLDFKKEQNIDASNFLNRVEFNDDESMLVKRPPVITIMGHVDHGKTTLLDYIHNSKIAQSESSGITQHVGAYQVKSSKGDITFIDTPGHEIFTQMRSRGAQITDIVILVVAADDGVMPQTKEAIQHSKAANAPIIVFVNKMDKAVKDTERVKRELAENDVIVEEYGGDVPIIYGSAKTGEGIDLLLDTIIALADLMELKANPSRYPAGIVLESRSDKGVGTVSTLIITNGTLFKGDFMVAGSSYGRIKALKDTAGNNIESATPGTPVVVSGLNTAPLAGDRFISFEDEKYAKKIALEKQQMDKKQDLFNRSQNTNDEDGKKILNVIIRSDVQGTAEALKASIDGMNNNEAIIKVIGAQSGQVTNSDLLLAQTSNTIIVTFRIKPSPNIKQNAKQSGIKIAYYDVVYSVIEDMQAWLDGEKAVIYEEKKIGSGHVVKTFFFSKVGTIAGVMLDEGVVKAGCKVKIIRNRKLIYEGVIDSLKRDVNDVKEVEKGKDFGMTIKKYNDFKEDDIIEFFEDVAVTI